MSLGLSTSLSNAASGLGAVQYELAVPAFTPGQPPAILSADPGDPFAPRFLVDPPFSVTAPVTITVTATQIQYAQTVILNFAGLLWPHVSVATLTPKDVLPVPASAW